MAVGEVLVLRGSQGQYYLRFLTMKFLNAADGLCLQGVKNQSQMSPGTK
jgi:hypothetical protein